MPNDLLKKGLEEAERKGSKSVLDNVESVLDDGKNHKIKFVSDRYEKSSYECEVVKVIVDGKVVDSQSSRAGDRHDTLLTLDLLNRLPDALLSKREKADTTKKLHDVSERIFNRHA